MTATKHGCVRAHRCCCSQTANSALQNSDNAQVGVSLCTRVAAADDNAVQAFLDMIVNVRRLLAAVDRRCSRTARLTGQRTAADRRRATVQPRVLPDRTG